VRARTREWLTAVVVVALVGAGGAAAWWWWTRPVPPLVGTAPAAPPPQAAAETPRGSEPSAAIRHPIEALVEPCAPPDATTILGALFGNAARSMFQLDDFARRFAATVDNLGRSGAPARVWPVLPTAGRFSVEPGEGGEVIAAENARRYAPFVRMVEAVDAPALVDAYRRLYPQLQRAYEELGYPGRHLNDRVVDVIDVLLATPQVAHPRVHLPAIDPSVHPARPWVLYQFDDPALESLTSGQKMLLRMGPDNQRRLMAKLREVRRLLTAADAAHRTRP